MVLIMFLIACLTAEPEMDDPCLSTNNINLASYPETCLVMVNGRMVM